MKLKTNTWLVSLAERELRSRLNFMHWVNLEFSRLENSDRQGFVIHDNMIALLGSRDGTVLRTVTSHQCDPV